MPKKFKGENTKAVAAKERRSAQQAEIQAKKQKDIEDAYWADDDKHIARKQARKDDREKKRLEQLERKKELAQLVESEMDGMKVAKPKAPKLTRAEIERQQELERLEAAARKKAESKVHDELPLEENLNRVVPEGDTATSVEDAIAILSVKEAEVEKHPEKRMKAAYLQYEEINLPILKKENPNMRLSQLKQMLKKDWMKSPENPMNQRHGAYNEK